MFDPTSRIQSAHLHGAELHHSARHRTHHAADHALRRRTARSSVAPTAVARAPQPPDPVRRCRLTVCGCRRESSAPASGWAGSCTAPRDQRPR